MKQTYDIKCFVYGQVYRQENNFEDYCLGHMCPKGPDLREAVMGMEKQGKYRFYKEKKN